MFLFVTKSTCYFVEEQAYMYTVDNVHCTLQEKSWPELSKWVVTWEHSLLSLSATDTHTNMSSCITELYDGSESYHKYSVQ